eukprot:363284-Chlamydomonas_euryale.AAC.9
MPVGVLPGAMPSACTIDCIHAACRVPSCLDQSYAVCMRRLLQPCQNRWCPATSSSHLKSPSRGATP